MTGEESMKRYFTMTVDVDPPFSPIQNFIIVKGVISLLDLFDQHAIKATFFVPAVVAENFPKIINEIAKRNHEIACHGLKHDPEETALNVNKQIWVIKTATEIINSVTGVKPVGYRAPLFRANKDCWKALQKNGYMYDSSLIGFPSIRKYRACLQMHPFSFKIYNSSIRVNEGFHLLELPVSTNPILPFPLGGGWLRILGLKWAKIGVKMNFLSKTPVVFYIHPKDVVAVQTPGLFWYNYRNTANGLRMLDKIIEYAKSYEAEFLTAYELVRLYKNKFENLRPVVSLNFS